MYKLFFILSVFIFAKVANAQDADIVYKHAVSVNLTSPLIQAINKNKPDSTSLRIPTNLAYSFTVKNKWMFRIGAGGYNNYQSLSSDIFQDRKITNINKLSALASAYHLTPSSEKWLFGIGISVSAVYNQTEKLFDSGFDVLKSYSYSKGGGIGPGVLFQYKLNNRLALFTEYNALFNLYTTAEGKEFSSYPEQNYAKTKEFNQGIQFQFPLALYINYLF